MAQRASEANRWLRTLRSSAANPKPATRRTQATEKKADPFYYSSQWKKVRQAALMRDGGMCVRCMERFRAGGAKPRRADMVHHIVPREKRPDLALTLENLESLCSQCHNKEHPEKGQRGEKPENPLHMGVRIIKI